MSGLILQEAEFGEPLGDHQKISEGPPAHQQGKRRPDIRQREGEPADQEPDGIVGRFGDGIEEGNVLGPNRFDVVDKTSKEESQDE